MKRIVNISELKATDVETAGGKGANLGELMEAGFQVPPGFVLTAAAYDHFLEENNLIGTVKSSLSDLDEASDDSLDYASMKLRDAFESSIIPEDLKEEIKAYYEEMFGAKDHGSVAVRSSATAEDLPTASFAGQQDTYLGVQTLEDLSENIKKCWGSLFTSRALSYRASKGFDHAKVKLAVVIQRMIDSEVSGIMFTVDPNSELPHIIIEAGYGLGEAMVGGKVTPDTYVVDKFHKKIINKKVSRQKWKLVRGKDGDTERVEIDADDIERQKLSDEYILDLAEIGNDIELHYDRPMDVEWCLEDGTMYIVQARPVTTLKGSSNNMEGDEETKTAGKQLTKGMAASPGRASGKVKILEEDMSLSEVKEGDIMVTSMTSPDMVPAMIRSAAIVTDEGGMTCHAAIVARELGIPCVVGTSNATKVLENGQIVTVDGSTGVIIEGSFEEKKMEEEEESIERVRSVPVTGTKVMVNIGIPQKAEEYAKLPVSGVGLMRIEFLFTSYVQEHPLYLMSQGKEEELVDRLAEGISQVARPFYPRPIVLRTSDFKTNEYREMKGGENYEPREANPMLGWRGCSRYVSDEYREAFKLELEAIKKAREERGLKNIWVMLPFVRTVEELKDISQMMAKVGLNRGKDFKLFLMAEVPCNIFMADEFSEYCDGFSIGSNDLTQLIMGADRDSEILGRMGYFDERNEAIKRAIKHLLDVAHQNGKVVSICGQAPSVYPEFTEFLVREGIDSISLNPDTVIDTISMIASVERRIILESMRE